MTNRLSNHIKSVKLDTIAKAIPNGLSVRVSYDNVDIFLKRTIEGLGPSITQVSRGEEGWTYSKIFQNEKKDKTWISAKTLKFDNVEKLLDHLESHEKNVSSAVIDRYEDNSSEIRNTIEGKAYPERGDIVTFLQAGADMDDVIILTEKTFTCGKKASDENIVKMVTPKEIKDILDREVIGNEHAKRTIATAVAKHISTAGKCPKTNVLIVGESGTGKTELIRALKKHREWNYNNVPVISYDASQLTPSGWAGINISDIINQVISENPELSMVEQAIIQLDEMDKITECKEYGKGGLLKQLLKLVEGGKINAGDGSGDKFTVNINGEEDTVTHIDTSKMLFIISGVYAEFSLPEEKAIGFNKAVTYKPGVKIKINHEEVINSGVIPVELMGRIHAVTTTERMSKKQWRQCVEGKILRDYRAVPKAFNMDIDDIINDDVIAEIVEETYGSKQGLRSSINMVDTIINDAIYEKATQPVSRKKPQAA